mmetsp:Transcript_35383/g.41700  ORF Transcript_35383/g.41700 Transcript_35383/m.41700 type:complete len:157 (-) Transcript_35383:180-650(-)|eukprot:CAMPEP_0114335368 /NCGR_PEP_ID=MMETSP0101-20121206/5010_1 /TAXON_ID=38822 ORGANISM="Pteridomonas danica, Strain PT" /NCGR_SAMPLE_ID=MMETSP0101 /ASSEMBLY_ACC=CAM_ASM_000211 /LENGTH=156 /DNA_ID=CAMNT_0001466967 /DNA_START=29 /DNA_END=499 /DNA_ORIENTATION=+
MAMQLLRGSNQARPMLRLMSTNVKPYSERMAAKGRPISPHVMIYSFPMVAISSITVRVTGVLLTAGTAGIAAISLVHPDVGAFMMGLGNSSIGPLAKFSVAFPLLYHYLGGVRHAVWDKNPEMITNEHVEKMSYALIAAATVGSVGAAAYSTEKKE